MVKTNYNRLMIKCIKNKHLKTWIIQSLLFVAIGIFSLNVKAQQTGSFTDSVSFMGKNRVLAGYVPTSYDSTTSYRLMISLHGLGDNAVNFRDALINSLNWETVFLNTVFICPDGGDDQNKDFYTPSGYQDIIQKAIDYAVQHYNIDTSNIILEGFSLGGRSALKYGLDNPQQFKGLLLNTPAIQGLGDALNDPNAGVHYDYTNASQVPIYVTLGGDDIIYVINWKKPAEQLKKHNAILKTVEVSGLGHTIPGSSYIDPAVAFFDNPASADYDLDLFQIDMEDRICDTTIAPGCYIRNLGDQAITSIDIKYVIDGDSGVYNWNGNIGMYEHALIHMDPINISPGEKTLELSIDTVNTSHSDTIMHNNSLSKTIDVATSGKTLPLAEGFEGAMENWILEQTGSIFSWYLDEDVQKDGQYSIASFNTILLFYTDGYTESFMSPVLDLTTVSNPAVSFDIAFNYHKYTPPYFSSEMYFADTLIVSVSTDCGQTYQQLYKKGGDELATTANPILNPLNIQNCFFQPGNNEWRVEEIDLSSFSNEKEAIVKFTCKSNMGGSMYIDNINFDVFSPVYEKQSQPEDVRVFPNPAQNKVSIQTGSSEKKINLVNIYDMSGKRVLSKENLQHDIELDVRMLCDGLYMIEVIAGDEKNYEKLIIKK
ncbi:MAG: T9SS type A sorting domain-containing protein [Bacteroidales bacterium]